MTDEVQSLLVSHLTSEMTTSVDDLVYYTNFAFSTLNWIDADYGLFYEDAKNMIVINMV
ncbi:hypothetical protein R3W88_031249 [Solanum pinnatisectum]|uniref:Uncharacterized protein n=1 Tax=Solanum pinnatisectum TaxID=50273 RepID=A0AAV9LM31_9SOLN|nr:hypothetical protein R3W88_031249 [Solanum pinnatisectum]